MPTCTAPTVPVTAGGTVYYVPPVTVTTSIVYSTVAPPRTSFSPTATTFMPAGTSTTMQPSTSLEPEVNCFQMCHLSQTSSGNTQSDNVLSSKDWHLTSIHQ